MKSKEDANEICTCGRRYGVAASVDECRELSASLPNIADSFVHLPLHINESPLTNRPVSAASQSSGQLGRYILLQQLDKAAREPLDPPRLCIECVHRVETALMTDARRLEWECSTYTASSQAEQLHETHWKRALESMALDINLHHSDRDRESYDQVVHRVKDVIAQDIRLLTEACQQHESDIVHMAGAAHEQLLLNEQLEHMISYLDEDHNSLELQARAFMDEQELLLRSLAAVIREENDLVSTQIQLIPLQFRLLVDKERGLRYPLIDNLRLAYRPKGDVDSEEIQAAWSLAAQLLVAVGSSFDFQSSQWRIVPLSDCAKILYSSDALNGKGKESEITGKPKFEAIVLGDIGNESKALKIMNRLLCLIVRHVSIKMHNTVETGILRAASIPALPFEISTDKIGEIIMATVDDDDDRGWSHIIHCMACILTWLSECSAAYVLPLITLQADAHGVGSR